MRDKIFCIVLGMSIVENLHTGHYIWALIEAVLCIALLTKD